MIALTPLIFFAMTTAAPPEPRLAVEAAHRRVAELVARAANEAELGREVTGVLDGLVDWTAFSARTLTPEIWGTLDGPKQQRFIERYRQLITKRYAKHFEPKRPFRVEFREGTEAPPAAGTVWVRTTVFVTGDGGTPVGVDVDYLFVPSVGAAKPAPRGGWGVADLEADGVSRALTYRKSFTRILQKDGFDALMAALERNLQAK